MILVAGAIAAGANLGLLGAARSSSVGHLKPADAAVATTDPSPQVVTVEVRDPAHNASARVVSPSESGSGPTVQVETIPVPAKATASSSTASHEVEHETSSTSGASADD
jgi:hypothetical protein